MQLLVSPLEYKNKKYIQLTPLRYIKDYINIVKKIKGAVYSPRFGWYIPYDKESYTSLVALFGKTNLRIQATPKENKKDEIAESIESIEVLKLVEQLMIKRYSPTTIKNYRNYFQLFCSFFVDKSIKEITDDEVKYFILHQVEKRKWSETAQNTCISAIKFYYENVLHHERKYYDFRPKKQKSLPHVLSEQEVVRLFGVVENIKHKTILMLIYSAGLRLSELVQLRKEDILVESNQIFVKAAKGKKDRYTVLSARVLVYLQKYLHIYKPDYWLFEGEMHEQYSGRSVQAIMHRAVQKSGVNSYTTVHTLRHSFATHLLERGTDIRYIQHLLGHNSVKTTEIYTHITQSAKNRLQSPLDSLNL